MSEAVLFQAVHFVPLFLAFVLLIVTKLDLVKFIFLMLILSTLKVIASYFILGSFAVLAPSIIFVLSLIGLFALAGFMGQRMGLQDYKVFFVIMAMFPWYVGWWQSLLFIFLCFVFISISSYRSFAKAKRKWQPRSNTPAQIILEVGKDNWNEMINGIQFVIPTMLAGLVVALASMVSVLM